MKKRPESRHMIMNNCRCIIVPVVPLKPRLSRYKPGHLVMGGPCPVDMAKVFEQVNAMPPCLERERYLNDAHRCYDNVTAVDVTLARLMRAANEAYHAGRCP